MWLMWSVNIINAFLYHGTNKIDHFILGHRFSIFLMPPRPTKSYPGVTFLHSLFLDFSSDPLAPTPQVSLPPIGFWVGYESGWVVLAWGTKELQPLAWSRVFSVV